MEPQEYERMFEQEDRHWWFQGRYMLVRRVLERHSPRSAGRSARLLDIGCGTGMFLQRLAGDWETFGLDFSRQALEFSRSRGLGRLVCGDSQVLPYRSESFDVVTAFDLIEHVDRDRDLVREAHRVLRPGGILLATVPAHPSLWGRHDVALHHKRRYRWGCFDDLFAPRQWQCRRMTWMFAGIYPPAAAIRSLRRWIPTSSREPVADTNLTPDWLNSFMIGWHRLEAAWTARFDLPFGLSILTVREKRRADSSTKAGPGEAPRRQTA